MNTKSCLKIIFLIIIILGGFINNSIKSQTIDNYIKWGDDAFADGDYFGASNFYRNALQMDSNNIDILYKIAESEKMSNNYSISEQEYSNILNKDNTGKYPLALFWLAVMNKNNGKYEESFNNFNKYYALHNETNDYYTKYAKYEIDNYPKILKIAYDTLPIKIENVGPAINTDYSEFGAVQLGDSCLFFSSLRNIDSVPEGSFFQTVYLTKIYISQATPMGWKRSSQWKTKINSKDKHDANITFSNDHKCLFFTRCKADGYLPGNCEIFISKFSNGAYQKPEKLDNKINVQGYSSTQPYFSGKNCSDEGVLYFASDRPGGYGKFDIWYSIYKNGKFNEAVNLGSIINTPGNEITPFYHTADNTLYFSSDWHTGIGGYDIFSSRGALNEWQEVVNAGVPFNSNANDLYFTINEIDNDGYLTSNRRGAKYIKGETCCNDIFSYTRIAKKEQTKQQTVEIKKDTIIKLRQTIRSLLPITLYFHNDEPDPNSWATESSKNYQQTLMEYIQMRDIYKAEYSKGLNGEQKTRAENDIDDFFTHYVMKGFTDLQKFTSLLLYDLQSGSDIHIKIKGFCSPLNTTEYNLNLARRRISSFKKYIEEYAGGVFIKYLNGTSSDGGRLTIYDDPIGKEQASPFVSDNPNDKRNSIYSRAASFERKIQLVMYSEGSDSISTELPELSLKETTIDLGKVKPSSFINFEIKFSNTGNSELVINNIETTSAALSISSLSKRILPGAEDNIKVSYTTPSLSGIYTETITFISNSAKGKDLVQVKVEVADE